MLFAFMKNLWISCLFLLSSLFISASISTNPDSLKRLLPQAKPAAQSAILYSLARVYEIEGNTDLAIENLTKAFNLFKQLKDEKGMADCQSNLGLLLVKKKKYSPAKDAYVHAIEFYDNLRDKKSMIEAMNNIGILEEAIAQNDSASRYYHKGITLAAELGDSSAAINLFINQGNLLLRLGKFSEAKILLNKGIGLALESGSGDEQIRGMQTMANLLYKQGNYKDAFNYLKRTSHLSDSISGIRNKQFIAAMAAKKELEIKEAKIQSNQQESLSESKSILHGSGSIFLLVILAILTGLLSAIYYLRNKNKNKTASQLNDKNLEIEKLENKLKVINLAKDKIFSIITNDLRKPFTTILGFANILKEDFENIDEKERIHYIRAIHSSLFNIYELLKNLLDWSRTQTGTLECNPAMIDLHQLTEQNVQLFTNYARNKDIQLGFDISGEAVIYADRNMVSTVIRNLLNNAIKFTNRGGEVHITIKDVDHGAELSITDTGTGIAENNLEKLFQLGHSILSKGTADESGTGLGLILCKEYISMNHGTIHAESSPGKGSRFIISLPVRSPESVQ